MNSTIAGHPRPSGGVELYAWLFMRISGLVLIFLALGHLIMMHMIHTVDRIDYQFVAGRYANVFWRGYDLAMLLLALMHGTNGIRYLIDDYTRPGKWRMFWIRVLYTTTIVFAVLGTWVIVAFQPLPSTRVPEYQVTSKLSIPYPLNSIKKSKSQADNDSKANKPEDPLVSTYSSYAKKIRLIEEIMTETEREMKKESGNKYFMAIHGNRPYAGTRRVLERKSSAIYRVKDSWSSIANLEISEQELA